MARIEERGDWDTVKFRYDVVIGRGPVSIETYLKRQNNYKNILFAWIIDRIHWDYPIKVYPEGYIGLQGKKYVGGTDIDAKIRRQKLDKNR